jgi:hypothetical protein
MFSLQIRQKLLGREFEDQVGLFVALWGSQQAVSIARAAFAAAVTAG